MEPNIRDANLIFVGYSSGTYVNIDAKQAAFPIFPTKAKAVAPDEAATPTEIDANMWHLVLWHS